MKMNIGLHKKMYAVALAGITAAVLTVAPYGMASADDSTQNHQINWAQQQNGWQNQNDQTAPNNNGQKPWGSQTNSKVKSNTDLQNWKNKNDQEIQNDKDNQKKWEAQNKKNPPKPKKKLKKLPKKSTQNQSWQRQNDNGQENQPWQFNNDR